MVDHNDILRPCSRADPYVHWRIAPSYSSTRNTLKYFNGIPTRYEKFLGALQSQNNSGSIPFSERRRLKNKGLWTFGGVEVKRETNFSLRILIEDSTRHISKPNVKVGCRIHNPIISRKCT